MGNHRIGISISHILRTFLVCFILLGFSSPTFADISSENNVYDLILEVKRDRRTLSVATFGLEKDGKYYVPVQELARIVKFNANVDLSAGIVSGFFISEKNSYSINANKGTYSLRGKNYDFDPGDTFVLKQEFGIGDVYITPDLLNKIWPLDLSLNHLRQILEIRTSKKLPYELFKSRQRKRNNRLTRQGGKDDLAFDLPKIDNSYKMFSLPAVDFSSTTRIGGPDSGIGQTVNITGRNDLLHAQASYNFSFDREPGKTAEFTNARFLLEKQSYDEGDLPLGLQLAQLGDVRPRPSRLIDGSLVGRGFLLSTESQKQIRDFDQITVEGQAEPGWEVELYRGSELIDFQIVDDNGEYRFENVTLNFNNTIIRTILYGPEGQIREEEKAYNISNSMLQPGKTIFEASILDLNKNLISTSNKPKNQPEGFTQNYKLKHGINSWFSAFATFTGTPTKQQDRNYGTLGLNLSFLGMSGVAEIYKDFSGGMAYDLRTAGNFLGANVNLRTSIFSDFESEEARFDGAARTSRTELSLSKPFKLLMGNIGFRFNFDHERFKQNPDRTEFDFSQTFSMKGLRLTHGNTSNLVDRKHQNFDGRVNATYKINPNWQLRSLLNYDIFPDKQLRNLLSELRYRDGNKFTAAIDVNRNFQDKGTRLGGQVSYDFDKFRTGLNVDWEKDDGFRAFLRATFSLAPYGVGNDYILSSQNLSNRSALNARVFLDKNDDGIFNEDDEPIKEAKVNIGRRETNLSNGAGYADYIGSSRNDYENISLDTDTLENPFMVPGHDGVSGVLRPATSIFVDFPVIETGIIDGTVVTDLGPLAGVRMELLIDNELIDTTSTAFDGYYTFEYVEPGSYQVRIDPSYEQVRIPPREILVTSENLFHYDVDFQIFEQADEVACIESDDSGRITQQCHDFSMRRGVSQPAHIISEVKTGEIVMSDLRMAKKKNSFRIVLDYNQEPERHRIIRARDKKEISVILPNTDWQAGMSWNNATPEILKAYSVERLPNGDVRLILKPVDTMQISASEILNPSKADGYRVYFDLIK